MTAFQNLKRQTLADSVYVQLRAAILGGEIADGAELNQVTLAQQFDVSRVPVREALRRLQAERLVTATPYQQFIVSAVKAETLAELIELREQIEAYAVRKHTQRVTPEMIQQMRTANAALRKQEKKDLWLAEDLELHELMNGPGTEAARMVRDLRSRVQRYLNTVASTRTRQKQACVEHDRVITAMANGDSAGAEAAIREHVLHTRETIVNYVNKNATP
jgi:DNA-binding GntR family transcriptional regulator